MAHHIIPRVPPEGPNERWYSDLENGFRHYDVSITPALVAANISAEELFTVTGINSSDIIIINSPAAQTAGTGIVGVRASAKDQIGIMFINTTAGGLTPASGSYSVLAIRG